MTYQSVENECPDCDGALAVVATMVMKLDPKRATVVYNPDFTPESFLSLGRGHKGADQAQGRLICIECGWERQFPMIELDWD